MKVVPYSRHIRQLRANLAGTRRAITWHRRMCHQCNLAHRAGQPRLACDTGWQWAKDESKFARALERAGHPELVQAGDQLQLF